MWEKGGREWGKGRRVGNKAGGEHSRLVRTHEIAHAQPVGTQKTAVVYQVGGHRYRLQQNKLYLRKLMQKRLWHSRAGYLRKRMQHSRSGLVQFVKSKAKLLDT